MRTTLTLDDDVAKLLERVRRQRRTTLKQVVNEALREGLARLAAPRRVRKEHATKAVSLGRCLVGSVDDVADALAVAEGEGFR
jgi:hypothetical protein